MKPGRKKPEIDWLNVLTNLIANIISGIITGLVVWWITK